MQWSLNFCDCIQFKKECYTWALALLSIQQYNGELLKLNTTYQTAQFRMHHSHTGTGSYQMTLLISAHIHSG